LTRIYDKNHKSHCNNALQPITVSAVHLDIAEREVSGINIFNRTEDGEMKDNKNEKFNE